MDMGQGYSFTAQRLPDDASVSAVVVLGLPCGA
jgi:hypothetical protein